MDIKNRNLTFSVKGHTYNITYPTIGQLFSIESEKALLSRGQLGAMLDSSTIMGYKIVNQIAITSFLKVMTPKLIEDLEIDILNIDAIDFLELERCYEENIRPWYDNWYKLYTKSESVDEKKK